MSNHSTGPAFEPVSVVGIEREHQPRRGRLVAALIVGVVVVVFGFATVVIVTYHPVEAESAVKAGRFAERPRGGRADTDVPVRFRFEAGRGTTVGVLLRNGGRLTIKLEEVEIDAENAGGVVRQTKARLPLGKASRTVLPENTQSFRSIGLDPGEAQWVILVLRFSERCPEGQAGTVGALRVRYSVFELPKSMQVPLRDGLRIPCPPPRRKSRR